MNDVDVLRQYTVDDGGCWMWQRAKDPTGYGRVAWHGKVAYAHRAMWEAHHSEPVPDGLVIDHICRRKGCINPDHLDAVSQLVNVRRTLVRSGRLTRCKHGHEFTDANTRLEMRRDHWGIKRICRTCDRDRARLRASREA